MPLIKKNLDDLLATPVDLVSEIEKQKKELNAVILAHYYQVGEIQDVADYVGDSLGLSRTAAEIDADVIVFAGVHFMAETAKILSPEKTVLLPDTDAGCSLAESMPTDEYKAFLAKHPGAIAVNYVNSTAAIKALTDYCVTSSNAVDVVKSLPEDKPIVFGPDKYLGDWVIEETGRDMILWEGTCMVHEVFSGQAISDLVQQHPEAKVLAHPECPAPIRALGDVIGSTAKLLGAVRDGDPKGTYIVVTEPGIVHAMQKEAPDATFINAPAFLQGSTNKGACTSCNDCPHMKRNTLQKLHDCMVNKSPEITLNDEIIERALLPIERMLAIG